MIAQDSIDKAGGDWAGYGQIDLKAMIDQGKVQIFFANKGLLIEVQTASGAWGTYNIKASDIADF